MNAAFGAAHGVLVIDKPRGPTSHDVVTRVRRALGTRQVGHAGTLDPMASGVLVVAVGEATKLAAFLTDQFKIYETTIAFGVATDTLDALGRPTRQACPDADLLDALGRFDPRDVPARLAVALEAERTRTAQVPPAYSAIQTQGVRAYARARRGETIDLPPRPVSVSELVITAASRDPPSVSLRVAAGKGYYVRSLARDLSEALGTMGHLTALCRIRSGCFTLEEAIPADVASLTADRVLPLAEVAARAMPVARLTAVGADDARHGRAVRPEHLSAPSTGLSAWFDPQGRLIAVGRVDEHGAGQVQRGFAAAPSDESSRPSVSDEV